MVAKFGQSDGTEAGTVLVKDIRPGSSDSIVGPSRFTSSNGAWYFTADDGVHGAELWKITPRPTIPGDVNDDGVVNIFDINLVSSHWGETGPSGDANHDDAVNIFDINLISANWTVPGDVNHDGQVNIFDINLVSSHWGEAGPTADANHDGAVNIFDINLISANWKPGSAPAQSPSGASAAGAGSSLRVASATVEPAATAASDVTASRISIPLATHRGGSQRTSPRAVDRALAGWHFDHLTRHGGESVLGDDLLDALVVGKSRGLLVT